MEEKPFRVLLDFSEANRGVSGLKYVWMYVSPRELKTIDDFKQAIIRKFSIPQEGFKLYVRDGLLLETEKIAILREEDTVKIQLENPCETSMESSAPSINVSMIQASGHTLSNSVVSLDNSRKRKSETLSMENYNLSANSKKKKNETLCISDESRNFSSHEDLSGLDKNSIVNTSHDKGGNNKQPVGKKKKQYLKTPTSEFINFAMKLSEAEKNNQNVCLSDVNVTNDKKVEYGVSDSNLYKTAELFSKTNLSPIPESSTYVLSGSQTPLNLTESLSNSGSQDDGMKSRCKKRRRKRKRKAISTTENLGLPADVTTEIEGSFLQDVECDKTYNAYSNTRKHVIFRSPSPKSTDMSITMESDLHSSFDGAKALPIGNSNVKSNSKLDSSKNKSLKENTEIEFEKDCESVISELNKESTPFPKKKLKEKPWGVSPLPRNSSSSNTFSVENIDVSKTDVKPAYQNYTPLNSLPPVGTRLAYKVLELNEEYCPEVSDYKEGILRKVDPNTDELEIELIQEEIKPGKSGKFENLWKDEPPPDDQVIKTVSLNWTSLIDPRLIP